MNWLNRFKSALTEKDPEKITALLKDLPQFQTPEEMQEAEALMHEALTMGKNEQTSLKKRMRELKKTREFLIQDEQQNKPARRPLNIVS